MAYERKEFKKIAEASVYLTLTHDPYTTPEDDDGMTPKQREAWAEDEWHYVYAEVSIELDGTVLGSACYGGIEYGNYTYTDDEDQVTNKSWISVDDIWEYVGNELEGEAMDRALENVEKLTKWREAVACLESY